MKHSPNIFPGKVTRDVHVGTVCVHVRVHCKCTSGAERVFSCHNLNMYTSTRALVLHNSVAPIMVGNTHVHAASEAEYDIRYHSSPVSPILLVQ